MLGHGEAVRARPDSDRGLGHLPGDGGHGERGRGGDVGGGAGVEGGRRRGVGRWVAWQ